MTELETLNVRRLLVALDVLRCGAVDWEAAMDLAALIGAELHGLFVEDIDLVGLAALPSAFEVGRLSGQPRPLQRESLASALKRRVERTVSELQRAGKRRNIVVSHEIARGKLIRQALEQGEHGDVLFLVQSALGVGGAEEHRRAQARGPIVLLHDAGPAAALSGELAVHLARHTGAGLVVIFPRELFATEAEMREGLGTLLAKAPGQVQLRALAATRMDSLLDAARAARSARIVLGAGGPLISAEALEYLCGGFRGELILVQ